MITLDELEKEAQLIVDREEESISSWRDELADNAYSAIYWSAETSFQSAGRIFVWKQVLAKKGTYREDLPEREIIAHFIQRSLDGMRNGARWPKRSTSSTTNLLEQYVTQAWAELHAVLSE